MHVFKLQALLLTLALAACGGSSTPATTPTTPVTPAAAATPGDASCPAAVPGTSVTVEDEPNGAALVFVTTGDVAEIRRRAAAMAQMHNDHHAAMGPLPDGTEAGHDMSGHAGHDMSGHAGHDMSGHAGGMIGIHSKASASDVEGGAKIAFVAGGAEVAKLQGELRIHAQHFAAGTCAMGKPGKS
jgi:hypothetical protein